MVITVGGMALDLDMTRSDPDLSDMMYLDLATHLDHVIYLDRNLNDDLVATEISLSPN